jgi:hypothetical protein
VNLPNAKKSHGYEGITEDMDKITWLKPKVVAEFAFTEWTAERRPVRDKCRVFRRADGNRR